MTNRLGPPFALPVHIGVLLVVVGAGAPVRAASKASELATASHPAGPSALSPSQECGQVASQLAGIRALAEAGAKAPWTEAAARLASIEETLKKPADRLSDKWIAAIFGLLGVLVGGVMNGLIQTSLANRKERTDRQLATEKAKQDTTNAFVQWQLRQLYELYGPLRAYFGESRSLYDQMKAALLSQPERFRATSPPADRKQRPAFEIKLANGQWAGFRTVLHLAHVYGKGYGVDDYFDEIVAIGERITAVVQDKAGFVRPDHEQLIGMFGQYLAHFAVLKRVHVDVQEHVRKGSQSTMMVSETAAFPRQIEDLIDADYQAINRELTAWRSARTGTLTT